MNKDKQKEWFAFLRENANNPEYGLKEMSLMFGKSSSAAQKYYKYHKEIKITDETRAARRQKNYEILRSTAHREKCSKKKKSLFELERLLVSSDLPQITKYTILRARSRRKVAHGLVWKYNYYYSNKENILLYDKETKRVPLGASNLFKGEQYYTDKYGLKFLQAED